ncbi:MAG: amino acid adenylation domain-containing protein, partial [bacterium]|nr:amino acid adenylation domain-containing protein [bacterium]
MSVFELLLSLNEQGIELWADGDTLRYKDPSNILTPELKQELTARKQNILTYLHQGSSPSPPIRPVSRDTVLPLSFAQQRLWFLDQFEPGQTVYHIPLAFRLEGPLNITALEQSFLELVRRHEALRTTFEHVDGIPLQHIAASPDFAWEVVNLDAIPPSAREARLQEQLTEDARRPFDLSQGPLFRVRLLKTASDEHVLLLTMHHIIADGWSCDILYQELAVLYEAFSTGKPSPLPDLPIQYADFAIWQREWLQGERLDTQRAYWTRQLADAPVLDLPTDRPRPLRPTSHGAYQTLQLDPHIGELFQAFSQREGTTMFMTLLAAFSVVLSRYTGHTDLCIGTPVANRNHPDLEGLIGFFVNTLVLRIDLSGNPTFRDGLQRVRQMCLEAYAHQDLPFEQLVEALRPVRDVARQPVFQVMFDYSPRSDTAFALPGLVATALELPSDTAQFDLSLSVTDTPEGLWLDMEYTTELFEAATITRLLAHFQTLLAGIAAAPDARLDVLPILSPREYHTIVTAWNRTQTDYPRKTCLHELFEAQVERSPDAIVLVDEDRQVTYRELNARSNQLARYLKAHGVGPEVFVGICLERAAEIVVAMLGVLKAGGAYVPLDPAYPKPRLAFMLEDTQIPLLLTHSTLLKNLPETGAQILSVDRETETLSQYSVENQTNQITPDNLAYVMYTSGSTGKPKGSLIAHANVTRLFASTQEWFEFTAEDVWTLFHSYTFDFSVWEIWGALISGGKLVIVPYWVSRTPQAFYELLDCEKVTVLSQTPSAFRQLIQTEQALTAPHTLYLRYVIFGGEVLEFHSLKPWFDTHGDEKPQLINMYGITETTVHVTYRPLTLADVENPNSVIGRPIPDLQTYILGADLQLVPVGIPGELHIGGAGLTRGYLNRPDLTVEKFIPHPFSLAPGKRLYKSG